MTDSSRTENHPLPELGKALTHEIGVGIAYAVVKLHDELNTCWVRCYPVATDLRHLGRPDSTEFFPPFFAYGVALYEVHAEALLKTRCRYEDYVDWLNFALKTAICERLAPCRPVDALGKLNRGSDPSEWQSHMARTWRVFDHFQHDALASNAQKLINALEDPSDYYYGSFIESLHKALSRRTMPLLAKAFESLGLCAPEAEGKELDGDFNLSAGRGARPQIEKFANDAFSVARDRILADYAQKLNRLRDQVRRTRNRGAYLPDRIKLEKESVRTMILARADAWLEAFELFGVPSDAQAEIDLQTCARQMTGGSISSVRGDLRSRSLRLRIAEEGQGVPWHLEIERSMNSALKEGVLRLRRQQITSKNSEVLLQRALPAEGRAEALPQRAETAVTSRNKASLKPQFPNRAAWLKDRLRERSWNKHDLARQRGPDHKTAQKVLDGLSVREDVLEKLAIALSKKGTNVGVLDIPPN